MGKKKTNLYHRFLQPRSTGDDNARRELVVNILLIGMIGFAVVAFFVTLSGVILKEGYDGSSPLLSFAILVFFTALYVLSRRGFYQPVAYVFIAIIFFLATGPVAIWGILLPQGVLTYALVIIMTGVLLGSRVAFLMVLFVTVTLGVVKYLESIGVLTFTTRWMHTTGSYSDVIAYMVTFTLIAVVAWLSNRETERSLIRARKSEAELLQERKLLEKKVKERTKDLEQAHVEKLLDLQRFAEFGRTSSTLLHELANPLMSASLDLQQLEGKNRSRSLSRAREAIEHMEQYVLAARRQLRRESEVVEFDIAHEIERVVGFLDAKARGNRVRITMNVIHNVTILGDAVRFDHVISNLVSNAIDAYEGVDSEVKTVAVAMNVKRKKLTITVTDHGRGIQKEDATHVFEPFYTTKESERGTGIGLTIAKQSVEEAFDGTLTVVSSKKHGTEFTVTIPLV